MTKFNNDTVCDCPNCVAARITSCVDSYDKTEIDKNDPSKVTSTEIDQMTSEEIKNNDPVNHPKHYTSHPSGVECIVVTRHMNFNKGNAMKYLWRADEKGNEIEDLKKAIWYLNNEIERLGGK